ncbi:hypothetical protein D3C83_144240 [compost metagenome]
MKQRFIDGAGGVGNDQHHLKKRADEDDRDLRFVSQTQNGHRERTENRRWHVADEVDERLEQPRKQRKCAAQDANR